MTRRSFTAQSLSAAFAPAALSAQTPPAVTRLVRFSYRGQISYAVQEGEDLRVIQGDLFGAYRVSSTRRKLSEVKLLYPVQPPKILAVGQNYQSHLGGRKPPAQPEIFYKPITCLQNPGDPIRIPPGAGNVHYEGELVVVIGKTLSKANRQQAAEGIFGVTCGNDVSEREWQNGPNKDLQWWRAKGADTFGPMGPALVRGLDYSKLQLETRLNGKTVQKQSTADLLFDCPTIVSFVSQYVTLHPGDVIFTGTPGTTGKLSPGDVVEVEIEGIGVLRNPVVAG
ncbi:MAG: fumarylacetoacetate hydrolase family protein [Bryobacteraceae bacterium]|nr:fumarylacetoacetate hydrolase family protein [Bryobacteraceae bacterium]MDW8377689.1 fumarylacetoacetate hydrolase family protein [Bryobacterales bacterium]